MTKKSLELLQAIFGENSNLSLPIGAAEQVLEIRKWISEQLDGTETTNN